MTSYQYKKSHCGDKTILRPSYLHNGISYTGKTTSLYWIRALDACRVLIHAVHRRLVSAGYRSRHPDWFSRLSCDHRHPCHHMLVHRHQNWKHQHWYRVIFDDESRVKLYPFYRRSLEFHLFVGCNSPPSRRQTRRQPLQLWSLTLGSTATITHDTDADGSSFGACVPTCGGVGNDQESVWGICLGVLTNIQLLLDSLGSCG